MEQKGGQGCQENASQPCKQGYKISASISVQNVKANAEEVTEQEVVSSSLPNNFDYISHIFNWERREGICDSDDENADDNRLSPSPQKVKTSNKFHNTKAFMEDIQKLKCAKISSASKNKTNDAYDDCDGVSGGGGGGGCDDDDDGDDDVFAKDSSISVTLGGKFVVTHVDDPPIPTIPPPASILSSTKNTSNYPAVISPPPYVKKSVMFGEPSTYRTFTIENNRNSGEPEAGESGRRESMGSTSDDSYYDTVGSTSSTSSLLRRVAREKGLADQDPYYDTASSTSSTATLLKREVYQHRQDGASDKQNQEDLSAAEYLDLVQSGQTGQSLLAKTLDQVKKSLEDLSPTFIKDEKRKEDECLAKVKNTYLKNLIVLSIGFMLPYTAFFSLRNLQSSMNHENGLGLISMSTMYVMFVIGCIFATSIVQHIRPKYAIVASMFGQLFWTLANFYPAYYTLVPATGILGFAMAITWTAQGTYITSIAITYAAAAGKNHVSILGLFNGFFLFLIQTAQILGNLISSSIFNYEMATYESHVIHGPDSNSTKEILYDIPKVNPAICGAQYCHRYNIDKATQSVQKHMIYILLGVFASCILTGILILALLLNKLDVIFRKSKQQGSVCQKMLALFHLHQNKKLLLLVPFMVFLGIEEAYMFGEFTKSFITCPLGMHMIGYVMMCFGACNALSSFFFGFLQKYVHRIVIMCTGACLDMGLLAFMLLWMPTEQYSYVTFILAGAWGTADAIWQTQTCSICGLLFPKQREAAFASLRMYESVGFVIAFAYAQFICMDFKIFITGGTLIFALVSFLVMEYIHHKETKGVDISVIVHV